MPPQKPPTPNTRGRGDLHLHTHHSDGTYTPRELAQHAANARLGTIALTDHDTVEGCPATRSACEQLGVQSIDGTELTAEANGIELHILGYRIDLLNPQLLRETTRFQQVRQDRIREIVACLNRLQIPLQSDTVFQLANCRSPGRPHVARALVQERLCRSVDEAFDRFLKKDRPAWVPKCKMSAARAIDLIHQAGGLAVIAHPALNRADHLVPELVEAGIDGIECFHSKHSAAISQHYLRLAATHGLLVTGGSDCHGLSKGKPLIGTVSLPQEHLHRFLNALAPATSAH